MEFETLGTYELTYKVEATRADGVTKYSDEATYTFHVGPISELAVWDGGASPLVASGQRAYTIMAANNGPDAGSAVEVALSGVPEGTRAVLSGNETERDGEFQMGTCGEDDLCEAVWDLGRMRVTEDARIFGQRTEFPTLTLIPPAGAPASTITASISNTVDYSVDIDGTTHSANYFDYNADNDTDDIEARYGTGDGIPPGTPRQVKVQLYSQPAPLHALVRWDPVERLNLCPVTHYEVWASPETCQLPGEDDTPEVVEATLFLDDELRPDLLPFCYYVRAVNEFGVSGFWSEPAVASDGTQVTPQLSVRGGAAVTEGETARFTLTAFPPPVDDITINYTVTQQGDFVASGDLNKQTITMDDTGRAVITVPTQDDEVDEANGSITVTLNNGDGYTVSSAGSGSVTVLDDETSTAYFAQVSCPDCGETVGEGVGVANVEVTVWPAPAADLAINYTIDTTVEGAATPGDDFRINGSGQASGSVTVRAGDSTVNIPVQVLDDRDSENAEEVVISIADGEGYELGHSDILTFTLTVEDNDGPRAEFAVAESNPGEGAGLHNVRVDLSMAAPSGGLTIDYSVSGKAQPGTDYNISGLTGQNGSVTVAATQSSVNIPVSIIQDTDNEGDEALTLTLQPSPGSYTVGSAKVHKVTILDDDRPRASFASASASPNPHEGAGTVNVRVNLSPAAPTGGLTVSYAISGDAIRNRDYTVPGSVQAAAGDAFVDIPVTITDDGHSEARGDGNPDASGRPGLHRGSCGPAHADHRGQRPAGGCLRQGGGQREGECRHLPGGHQPGARAPRGHHHQLQHCQRQQRRVPRGLQHQQLRVGGGQGRVRPGGDTHLHHQRPGKRAGRDGNPDATGRQRLHPGRYV